MPTLRVRKRGTYSSPLAFGEQKTVPIFVAAAPTVRGYRRPSASASAARAVARAYSAPTSWAAAFAAPTSAS